MALWYDTFWYSHLKICLVFFPLRILSRKLLGSSVYFVNVVIVGPVCIFDILLDNFSSIWFVSKVNCKRIEIIGHDAESQRLRVHFPFT